MFEATTDKESLFTGIEKNLLLYKKSKDVQEARIAKNDDNSVVRQSSMYMDIEHKRWCRCSINKSSLPFTDHHSVSCEAYRIID